MYNVLDIARYVINYSNEKDYGISNLKLQKILYFIQAYFLMVSKDRQPCFKEDIEAWDFGPVVQEVYQEFKQYGSGSIPTIDSYVEFSGWDTHRVAFDDGVINDQDKQFVKEIVDKFSRYSATDLVRLTHNQDPWKNAYHPCENNVITNESIKEYFND